MKQFYRQGDINFHPVKEVEGELQEHSGNFIVAVGESTGHNHQMLQSPQSMRVLKKGQTLSYELLKPTQIVHQEHKPFTIMEGKYVQVQEREVDHFQNVVRKVVD